MGDEIEVSIVKIARDCPALYKIRDLTPEEIMGNDKIIEKHERVEAYIFNRMIHGFAEVAFYKRKNALYKQKNALYKQKNDRRKKQIALYRQKIYELQTCLESSNLIIEAFEEIYC